LNTEDNSKINMFMGVDVVINRNMRELFVSDLEQVLEINIYAHKFVS